MLTEKDSPPEYFSALENRLVVSLSSHPDPTVEARILMAEMRRSGIAMLMGEYVASKEELRAVADRLDSHLTMLGELKHASDDDPASATAAQNRENSLKELLGPIHRQLEENARARRNTSYYEAGYRLTELLCNRVPDLPYKAAEAVWYLWHSGAKELHGPDVLDPTQKRENSGKHSYFTLDKVARERWQKARERWRKASCARGKRPPD